jgi:hypothetical protein
MVMPPDDEEANPTRSAPRAKSGAPPAASASGVSRNPSSTPGSNPSGGRFLPGAMVEGRFRIVGLLGRGGMGEVYRADDLTLGMSVALKFLPETFAADPDRRDRFFGEVRVARQISHPNVCRIYDIGELDGVPYLSMEFVDGDDLASLLRRVGRLPQDKGVEIARQLCAGLSAAHEKGVLHRDLKPENVMIDGRGKVRIADFGLAAVAESVSAADIRSGTPAYMAPEQLAGREVTIRSDIYALGLVLYEVFTGKRAFSGKTYLELLRKHESEAPDHPSTIVGDLDPTIERAILRCLEKDPLARPSSALSVAISLPGGDPLAAAIAAGETPSPELVAAAGGQKRVPARWLWASAAAIVAAMLFEPSLSAPSWITSYVAMPKAPAVLEDKSREILRALGAPEKYADWASGFSVDGAYLRELQKDPSMKRWEGLRGDEPRVLFYWYRESPRALLPFNTTGVVFMGNPPALLTDMARVTVDMTGRLVVFQRVPPQKTSAEAAEPPPYDWSLAFRLAGLDLAQFKETPPEWVPPFGFDSRKAWVRTSAPSPELELRVEAASFQGAPVSFQLLSPWDRPTRMEVVAMTPRERAAQAIGLTLLALLVGFSIWLAIRGLKSGRADLKGSARLALTLFGLLMLVWVLRAQHSSTAVEELQMFLLSVSSALLTALLVGIIYLGLEPLARKLCPERLVSWTRLVSGGLTDPLVAGHILLGAGVGAVAALIAPLPIENAFGQPVADMLFGSLEAMRGLSDAIPILIQSMVGTVSIPLAALSLLIGLEGATRRPTVALMLVVLIVTLPNVLSTTLPAWIAVPWILCIVGLPMLVLGRFGVLPGLAAFGFARLSAWPRATDLSVWWATPARLSIAVSIVLILYGLKYGLPSSPRAAGRQRD